MSSIPPTHPLARIWAALGGDRQVLSQVRLEGPDQLLHSPFDVTGLAATSIALATLAVSELGAQRLDGDLAEVVVDRRAAAAAFRSEALQRAVGWELPPVWDPIAGNYRTADGWLRLHTNYAYHRTAALRALELPTTDGVDREQVAARTRQYAAADLEQRVVAAGGCAAVLHTAAQWAVHPHGRFAVGRPAVELTRSLLDVERLAGSPSERRPGSGLEVEQTASAARPLAGIKVLDLTRVIAGPVCTRTLAAWGAQVLRIDPPGFAEVPAVLPEMTVGKHCAALNLRDDADRDRFVGLLAEADVIVSGLRTGALAGLGFSPEALRAINPRLCIATLNAYGWTGPWAGRRGFDSLVQLSCGLAAASTASAGEGPPGALPAQALDHGTGYLLAAAVCRALTDRERGFGPAVVRSSLVGTANLLTGDFSGPAADSAPSLFPPSEADLDLSALTVHRDTEWGPMRAVAQPGTIGGVGGEWLVPAGPLGRHEPKFAAAG